MLPQDVGDLLPIPLDLHVDEVEDDDAAQVPQPKLPRDLRGRLEVRLEDRLFLVLLPDEAPGVHVDRDQGFGLVDRDVAALSQPHLPLHRLLDLGLDPKVIEDRRLPPIVLHPLLQVGRVGLEILDDLPVLLLRVDDQLVHVLVEDVPDEPGRELHLLMEERRRLRSVRLLLDFLPELLEVSDVGLELLQALLRAHRADDDPRVPGPDLPRDFLQPLALGPLLDLPGNADVLVARHVDQKPPRKRDLRRDARALGPDRLFRDLDQDLLALLQRLLDPRDWFFPAAAAAAASAAPPVPPTAARLLRLLLLEEVVDVGRRAQVRGVEEGALFEPQVHERRLHARQDRVHTPLVDVPDAADGLRPLHQDFGDFLVFEDRDPRLARRGVNDDLSAHPPPGQRPSWPHRRGPRAPPARTTIPPAPREA
jgi:hypothetical protein